MLYGGIFSGNSRIGILKRKQLMFGSLEASLETKFVLNRKNRFWEKL